MFGHLTAVQPRNDSDKPGFVAVSFVFNYCLQRKSSDSHLLVVLLVSRETWRYSVVLLLSSLWFSTLPFGSWPLTLRRGRALAVPLHAALPAGAPPEGTSPSLTPVPPRTQVLNSRGFVFCIEFFFLIQSFDRRFWSLSCVPGVCQVPKVNSTLSVGTRRVCEEMEERILPFIWLSVVHTSRRTASTPQAPSRSLTGCGPSGGSHTASRRPHVCCLSRAPSGSHAHGRALSPAWRRGSQGPGSQGGRTSPPREPAPWA